MVPVFVLDLVAVSSLCFCVLLYQLFSPPAHSLQPGPLSRTNSICVGLFLPYLSQQLSPSLALSVHLTCTVFMLGGGAVHFELCPLLLFSSRLEGSARVSLNKYSGFGCFDVCIVTVDEHPYNRIELGILN